MDLSEFKNNELQNHKDKVWKTSEQKTWLEVEMDETVVLLRKKLEKINEEDVDRIDRHDVWELKNIYKTLWYIKQLRCVE
jgi:hypothetical protein